MPNLENPYRESEVPKTDASARLFEIAFAPESQLPPLKDQLAQLKAPMSLSDSKLIPVGACKSLTPIQPDTTDPISRGLRDLYDWADGLRELFPSKADLITDKPIPRNTDKWKREHDDLVKKAQSTDANLVFYGDSITKGMSMGNALQNEFGCRAENFGIVGDSTQHLLWRMQNGEMQFKTAPEKGVILIGANNIGAATEDEIVKGIVATVNEARTRQPDTKWLVLGVLPQGRAASDPRRAQIERINSAVERELAGKDKISYLNVNQKMLQPDGSMGDDIWWRDGLHPRNYSPLFKAIRPVLDNL